MKKIILRILIINILLLCFVVVTHGQSGLDHVVILVVDVFEREPQQSSDVLDALSTCEDYDECKQTVHDQLENQRSIAKDSLIDTLVNDCMTLEPDNPKCLQNGLIQSGMLTAYCSNDDADSDTCIDAGEVCIISFGGQDGGKWDGGTGDEFLTSELYPQGPHGQLVYRETVEAILQYVDSSPTAVETPVFITSGSEMNPPGPNWLRGIETWLVNTEKTQGYITVVGIDTGGYKPDLVRDRLATAIADLPSILTEQGFNSPIDKYIINMSFGLIPCDKMPTTTPEDILYTWFAMMSLEYNEFTSGYIELIDPFLAEYSKVDPSGFDTLAEFIPSAVETIIYSKEPIDEITELEPFRDEFMEVAPLDFLTENDKSFFAVLVQSEFASIRNAVMHAMVLPEISLSMFAYYDGEEESVQLSSASTPLSLDFSRMFGISGTQFNYIDIVASAGNDEAIEPYFPASDPKVLSVSAYYDEDVIADCSTTESDIKQIYITKLVRERIVNLLAEINIILSPDEIDAIVDEIVGAIDNPTSNKGEIIHNGISAIHKDDILGCLRGTSFAAPRMAVETSIYLLDVASGLSQCTQVRPFDHPLSYATYQDRTRFERSDIINCTAFKGIPSVP